VGLESALHSTDRIAKGLGCLEGGSSARAGESVKECMQRKPIGELFNASGYASWGPTVDQVLLPGQPAALLAAGKLNPGVSVMWGGNTNDR
jgi:hypothetical protein